MKVVVAIDSLKGSLTSMEAGRAIRAGVLKADPTADVTVKPLADGGEGTTEALADGMGGELVYVDVHGPLETPVKAGYGFISETGTAIMEMAASSGIILVGKDFRPLQATTYGVGEMILDAIKRGCRKFIIGIGGSATNDCGIGMLCALGFRFLDGEGKDAGIDAAALSKVEKILTDGAEPLLKECEFRVACDVTNPLCGPKGATYTYGPQKGVTPELAPKLDADLAHFASVTAKTFGVDHSLDPGAGAAGGLGFAFMSFLNADIRPGIELVLDAVGMDAAMEGADLVFTGEGRLDGQTANGKAPIGIAKMAKKHGAKVVALAGAVTEDANECNAHGIDAFFPILRSIMTLDEAVNSDNARHNMEKTAEQVTRLLLAGKEMA